MTIASQGLSGPLRALALRGESRGMDTVQGVVDRVFGCTLGVRIQAVLLQSTWCIVFRHIKILALGREIAVLGLLALPIKFVVTLSRWLPD